MSTTNIDEQKIIMQQIDSSDTIKQFMEKCNNNFFAISKNGGGPIGSTGERGSQGVPTKPKVPIHVWNDVYYEEKETDIISESKDKYEIINYGDELEKNPKYQVGHLIILENAHVYKLEIDEDTNKLKPKFIFTLQSYDPNSVIDGKTAHVHFRYEDESELTDETINKVDKEFIGIYSDNSNTQSNDIKKYTWIKIKDKDELIHVDKINIDSLQGSKFVKEMFSKQVTSSAGFIVDSLNTKPEENNKVIIEGNNIKIFNDVGNISTLITSDDVDVTSELDNELDNTTTYNTEESNNNNKTKIGKNGIVVKLNNNKSEFHVSEDEILMKVGNYGLKITNIGIFKTNDGSSWEDLDDLLKTKEEV